MKSVVIEIPLPQVTDCSIQVDLVHVPYGYYVVIIYAIVEPGQEEQI